MVFVSSSVSSAHSVANTRLLNWLSDLCRFRGIRKAGRAPATRCNARISGLTPTARLEETFTALPQVIERHSSNCTSGSRALSEKNRTATGLLPHFCSPTRYR